MSRQADRRMKQVSVFPSGPEIGTLDRMNLRTAVDWTREYATTPDKFPNG
jgi:hypothetical protein